MNMLSIKKARRMIYLGGSLVALASATLSAAQGQAANDAASELVDNDIVVTAQRRSESLQKVPIAITAITSEAVITRNIRTIDKIQAVTPGLVFETGYAFPQMYIRGIGVVTNTPGLEQPVALYVDGAYVPRATGTLFGLVDVGSIQVLKGPQGTLYGRNATGGAILLTTADPTDQLGAKGTLEYGRFDHALGEVAVNIPAGDTLAFRFVGAYSHEDGYVKNIFTGKDVLGHTGYVLRGKAKWTPTPQFTAVLGAEYQHRNSQSTAAGHQVAPAPFCVACSLGVPNAPGFYELSEDLNETSRQRSKSVNLKLDYDADSFKVQSLTSYRKLSNYDVSDVDHSLISLLGVRSGFGGKTFEQDLQVLSSFDGPFNFLVGGQYIDDRAFSQQAIFGGAVGIDRDLPKEQQIYSDGRIKTETVAVFAEAYIKPLDRVTVTLGGRYSSDKRRITTTETAIAQAFYNPTGTPVFTQRVSYNKFTPRVVVAYDMGNLNVYASYTKGFKAGGFNSPTYAPQTTPIKPENIDSYELGAKFVSSDRRTHVNLSAFRYDYKDVQVAIVDVLSGGNVFTNAASARGKGFEVEMRHQASDWLSLSLGAAYLDANYRDYPNSPVYVIATGPTGAPIGYAAGSTDLSGSRLPRSPKLTINAGADLRVPLGADWVGRLSPSLRHTSGYDFLPGAGGPARNDRQGNLTIVNLSGGVGPDSGQYEIGFYVDNLTNKKYYNLIVTSAFGVETYVAKPATYGGRITFKF